MPNSGYLGIDQDKNTGNECQGSCGEAGLVEKQSRQKTVQSMDGGDGVSIDKNIKGQCFVSKLYSGQKISHIKMKVLGI